MHTATLLTLALAALGDAHSTGKRAPLMGPAAGSKAKLAKMNKRQAVPLPGPVEGYTTIKSPSNVTIRYKEPGKAGVCETTPGVGSYSG